MNSKSLKRIPKVELWIVFTALAIFAVTGSVKGQALLMPENTYVPPIPVPKVNARDYFIRATAMLTPQLDKVAPDNIRPTDIGTSPSSYYYPYTPAQKAKIVADNAPAFAMLKEGLKYPFEGHPVKSISTSFPYLAKFRGMARGLRIAAAVRASQGHYAAAIDYCLDGLEMGAKISHGEGLIGELMTISVSSISQHDMNRYIEKLNYVQAVSACRRLIAIDLELEQPNETFIEEQHTMQSTMLEICREHGWQVFAEDDKSNDPIINLELATDSPRTAYDNYTRYMNRLEAFVKLPWPEQIHKPQPLISPDPIARSFEPTYFEKVIFKRSTITVDNRMLELRLALHAYKLSHNRYPAKLTDLQPSILASLPIDPYSENETFRYKNQGAKYLLYSIGPDAVDDGGKPIYDTTLKTVSPYTVFTLTDKGDIVSGVNDF